MPTLNDVLAGSQAQAVQVQQIIDALKGTPNKGVPVALVSLNDSNNYALTVQNDDPINSRALSVLKADGTTLISADATGVTLGAPINVPAGSLNGTQLANASVTNAKLASDTARANLLTNPGFEQWQRGSGPFATTLALSADRWMVIIPSGTLSVSRDAANPDIRSLYCAACTATGAATYLEQQVKQTDGSVIAWTTYTLSMRVKTSTANAVRLRLTDASGDVLSSFHTGNGTYQTLTATLTTVGQTILYVRVNFEAACTAYVDNAMLVVGSVPADYAPLHPADDLARCLRYYETFGGTANEYLTAAQAYSTTNFLTPLRFTVRKAVTPTFTSSGAGGFICSAPNSSGLALGSLAATVLTNGGASLIGATGSGLTAGNATSLQSNGGVIFIEANP